jgi:NAD(P)-dependent dehydrogenase (short-subunit alcohol dehydrogenase family)
VEAQVLAGKVAIVTGAGRGIGRAEARHLAALRASVVVNDLPGRGTDPATDVCAEIVAAGGEAVPNWDDVADMDGAAALVRQAVDTFGGLDILVNNAGILRDRMVFNMGEYEWDTVLRVHLKGHFAPTRWATAYWRERAKGGQPVDARIVCTGSSSGLFGNAGQANYAAAKAGIAGFATVVAREMAKYGVTCNTICPIARTRLMAQALEAHGVEDSGTRLGADGSDLLDPAHVARLVGHLVGPGGAGITGQVFIVGGGRLQLAQGWRVVAEVGHDRALDDAEVAAHVQTLLAGRPTAPLPFAEAAAVVTP